MKTKHEKRIDALRRREAQLLSECQHNKSSVPTGDLMFYLREVNNVRRALGMCTLSISTYDHNHGDLIVTDGYTQFYPQEPEHDQTYSLLRS